MSRIAMMFGLAMGLHTGSAIAATVNLQWNGSGCPKVEEHTESSGDKVLAKHDVTSSFTVKRGPGVRLMESRKNCTLIVSAEGHRAQFALEKVEIQGKVAAASSKQELTVDVSSQGQGQTKSITLEGKSSSDSSFSVEKTLTESDQIWSSCDRGLMLNTKQRIEGDDQHPAAASVESISYQLKSKPCVK
ncbi:MAG: DUF4360 domain-containing protein [Oligoflexus sp.]|nr:DUF4360 domain-containing protein [Oligoflexus sp.]